MFVADPDWVDAFADAVHATMRRVGCNLNSCVEAGCIAVGVARTFGYVCQPVPVRVIVQAGKQATVLPGAEFRRQGGFAGHLVVHFPGVDNVVDLTSDQFHAPHRGLYVPAPLVFPVGREDLTAGFGVALPSGTHISYQEMLGDVSWQTLPAWTGSSAFTINLAVRELRSELERRSRAAAAGR